ncbi:hypothetical protein HME9302_00899 [Alteripontixanthobacter maritimus]|uniref:DUF11 domain-containing protein n=1 Tax=Alteripontixanthobacter maritimus TaxID=2161824 RepID=A0A369Q8W7_9SPHN|nr:hypothetical protein [Alteripontixanthobacter maritimus]RDC59707.1 hypothetical protein HME9302_00899 [Alteripontixanthobacter maritimus]
MTRVETRIGLIPIVLSAALAASAAHAEGVPAGTLIENTAQASYDVGNGVETVDSNTVTLKVDELLDVTVTSLDAAAVGTAPGDAVLTFELTNIGNGPEAFVLTTNAAVSGNDFDTTVDGIAVDTNGNGVYDPGIDEVLTGPETTAILPADGNLTVFVLVTVPNTATDSQQSSVQLIADAVTGSGAPGTTFGAQGENGVDAVVGTTGADDDATGSLIVGVTTVELVKTGVVSDPFGGTSAVPGAIITYTLSASVSGSGTATALVITDAIPSGTSYQFGTLALDAAPLTDADDTDAGEADATGIRVDLGNAPGGTDNIITFDVKIDE